MTRRTIEVKLAADVATSGTFTVSYPTGLTAGHFKHGKRHRLMAMQGEFEAPKGFTVSFGATQATITYLGTTTIPQGSTVYVELDMSGSQTPDFVGEAEFPPLCVEAKAVLIDFGSPSAASTTYYRAAAAVGGAGALTLLKTKMPETDLGRCLSITSSGNDSGRTFTVNSKDIYGNSVRETITGPNTTTVFGNKAHYRDITVSIDAASAGNISIGYGDKLGLPIFIDDVSRILAEMKNGVALPKPPELMAIPWELNATDLAAGTAGQIVSPVDGVIERLRTIVQVAIVTGGAITVNNVATPVDGLSITVADSATVGTAQSDEPTAGHATTIVTRGQRIAIVPAAAFNGGGAVNGTLEIRGTGLDGTLAVGSVATPTAATGDVRGTYDPFAACDGVTGFSLLVAMPNPSYKGSPQFAG